MPSNQSDITDSDSPALESSTPGASPPATDAELIAALRAGQVEAMRLIYRRYSRLVYTLALKILGSSEEAEDTTQEVFLTLWRRDTYQSSRGSLGRFLVTLTRSRSIDKLRSREVQQRFLHQWHGLMETEATAANPFEQVFWGERAHLIREALIQLPDFERQVLEIAYYEGLSQSEIAKRLNIPLGTVKTRSRQGLLKLRKILQHRI